MHLHVSCGTIQISEVGSRPTSAEPTRTLPRGCSATLTERHGLRDSDQTCARHEDRNLAMWNILGAHPASTFSATTGIIRLLPSTEEMCCVRLEQGVTDPAHRRKIVPIHVVDAAHQYSVCGIQRSWRVLCAMLS